MFLVPGWGEAEELNAQDMGSALPRKGAETLRTSGQRFSTSVSGYGICRNGSRHSSTGEGGCLSNPPTLDTKKLRGSGSQNFDVGGYVFEVGGVAGGDPGRFLASGECRVK